MERGLLFVIKKIFDEKEDYRVRLYIFAWVASISAIITLIIGILIFLFKIFVVV